MFAWVITYLVDNAVVLGGAASVLTIVEVVFAPFRSIARYRRKPEAVLIANPEVFAAPAPAAPPSGTIQMDVAAFTDLQKRLRDGARTELAQAHGYERKRLEEKIDALNQRLANPDEALAQQQAIIVRLEDQLSRRSNEIGGDDLAAAKAAVDQGDFAKAKALFETLNSRTTPDVRANADANFALGQIAEAEIRWHDAYAHYKRATSLSDDLEHLAAYAGMTWRLHLTDEALPLYQRLCEDAKSAFGDKSPEYATDLNNFACVVDAKGRYAEAEGLYRQVLAIDRVTIG